MNRLARRLFASVFLSAMLAALLSTVPALSTLPESTRDEPVFRPVSTVWITEDSLVDFLAGQPISLRILRVSWENGRLSLDLEAGEAMGEDRIHADLFTLIRNSLVKARNVESLRFRVYRFGNRDPWVSVEAGRGDLARDPEMRNGEGWSYRRYLERTFHVKYGDAPSG